MKAQLLDANQTPATDADLSSFPVLEITFSPASGGDPVDVTNDALAVGLGTQGNQFEFTGQRWQYNLDTSNYTAPGTYTLTMVAGDTYVISPTCVARFSIE